MAKVRFPADLVDQLMDAVGPDIELNRPDGLLASLQKAVLERALDAELTEHLGYERGDAAGNGSGNSRNGTTPKALHTETGSIWRCPGAGLYPAAGEGLAESQRLGRHRWVVGRTVAWLLGSCRLARRYDRTEPTIAMTTLACTIV